MIIKDYKSQMSIIMLFKKPPSKRRSNKSLFKVIRIISFKIDKQYKSIF
jgi:hypothetical protein